MYVQVAYDNFDHKQRYNDDDDDDDDEGKKEVWEFKLRSAHVEDFSQPTMVTVQLIPRVVCVSVCIADKRTIQANQKTSFSSCDRELWSVTLNVTFTVEFDVDNVKMNQYANYLDHRLIFSKRYYTDTDTHRTDCYAWATILVGKAITSSVEIL